MAIATNPTLSGLVTEALKKAGHSAPTATQITRATDEWFQEILNDIWTAAVAANNIRLKSLQETLIDVSILNTRTLDLPEDFEEEEDEAFTILDGTHRDTAQAGGASSITLASDEDATQAEVEGKFMLLTGGLGENGYRQAVSYDTSTKIALTDSAWDTTPDSTSTYLIVNKFHLVEEDSLGDFYGQSADPAPGIPSFYTRYNRQIIFDRPFDKATYGIRIPYFMNIHEVDLTEGATTRITRILQNWRNVIALGLQYKGEEDEDLAESQRTQASYASAVGRLIAREIAFKTGKIQLVL